MAELYLARTTGMDVFRRLVALKRILPHYAASPEFTSMFVDEARLVAQLEHPNIAQVFDIGRGSAGLFFTMEYVHGPDVCRILQVHQDINQRVPLEYAIAIVAAAARGLHAAHEKRDQDGESLGIVHRDVSPANVLVSFDGIVKMIDFGVAKARMRKTKTRDGTLKGKISYMSPEQCRGEPIDSRSDIFSLGILLYELTTTRKLFYGTSDFAILKYIAQKNAPRPSLILPDYPWALEEIVMRALSRNIGKRYQTAHELACDLDDFARAQQCSVSAAAVGAYLRQMFPHAWSAGQSLVQWYERAPTRDLAEGHSERASCAASADARQPRSPDVETIVLVQSENGQSGDSDSQWEHSSASSARRRSWLSIYGTLFAAGVVLFAALGLSFSAMGPGSAASSLSRAGQTTPTTPVYHRAVAPAQSGPTSRQERSGSSAGRQVPGWGVSASPAGPTAAVPGDTVQGSKESRVERSAARPANQPDVGAPGSASQPDAGPSGKVDVASSRAEKRDRPRAKRRKAKKASRSSSTRSYRKKKKKPRKRKKRRRRARYDSSRLLDIDTARSRRR
ncbi:MAG: protein kinase [Proteobacteria bacterium]|nr:protein kinase [Pseudomonadota bacterium]